MLDFTKDVHDLVCIYRTKRRLNLERQRLRCSRAKQFRAVHIVREIRIC